MRYLVKREIKSGNLHKVNYIGIGYEFIREVTPERIKLYGYKTLEGAEKAAKRERNFFKNDCISFTVVPFTC